MPEATEEIARELGLLLKDVGTLSGKEVSAGKAIKYETMLASAIDRHAPPGSAYKRRAGEIMSLNFKFDDLDAAAAFRVTAIRRLDYLAGVVRALQEDYQTGRIRGAFEMERTYLFSDFLDLAEQLVEDKAAGPAAVAAGLVLEEHLRKLAEKSDVPVTDGERNKSATRLVQDLAAAGAISRLEEANAKAWLKLRNQGAHPDAAGPPDEVQVERLIGNVRDFVQRHPA